MVAAIVIFWAANFFLPSAAFTILPIAKDRFTTPRGSLFSSPPKELFDDSALLDTKEYLATCIPGLAPYMEEELQKCGVKSTDILSNAAVSFTALDEDALKALVWVRTAHRILEKIDNFYDIFSRDDVYNAVQHSRIDIKDLLGDGQGGLLSLSVKVIANGGRLPKDISHSHYTALTIKNALVDQVRDLKGGERPDVDLDDPDVPLVAIFHSQGETAAMTLYRSLAPPASLHKRGYRSGGAIHKAAMKESLAAGLLLAAGWNDACQNVRASSDAVETDDKNEEGLTLVDPMCGSGSLLLEAAMMAVDYAPGLMRIVNRVPGHQLPPVLRWKENKDTLMPIWKEMLLDASQRAKAGLSWMQQNDGKIELLGNDIHAGALELTEASFANAGGLDRIVDLHQTDCRDWNILMKEERQKQQVWVMTNPPWGVRLSDNDHESWESLRTFLRSNCPGGRSQAWILSGNKASTKHLGLRRSQSIPLKTGQQDLRWIQYILLDKGSVAPHIRDNPLTSLSTAPKLKRDDHQRLIRVRKSSTSSASAMPRNTERLASTRVPCGRGGNATKDDDTWI